jgi:ABC-type transport system involved in cytochrome c biogenesis permease subunit
MNPQVTSLMPVLSSPWLSAHVSVVMIAYALFAFALFVSLTAVILHFSGRPGLSGRLQPMSQLLIYPAVLLLGVGIFLGSVWANVSWGSYWSWDAKEVWALLTMMVYAVLLHRGRLTFLYRPFLFHLLVIVFFLVLLMTYFGVNLLFEGMHSYK